jgi:hypothetical protein
VGATKAFLTELICIWILPVKAWRGHYRVVPRLKAAAGVKAGQPGVSGPVKL